MFGLHWLVKRDPVDDDDISGNIESSIFSFQGRIPRNAWWKRSLYGTIIFGAFEFLLDYMSKRTEEAAAAFVAILLGLIIAAHLFFLIAQAVKRFQDLNQPGWLVSLTATIVYIPFCIYWLGFKKGTEGANRYGLDPLEGESVPEAGAMR